MAQFHKVTSQWLKIKNYSPPLKLNQVIHPAEQIVTVQKIKQNNYLKR
jgi:hypothetical protein